jgi:hypothetical protein
MGLFNVVGTSVCVILVEKAEKWNFLLFRYCGMTVLVTLLSIAMLLLVIFHIIRD